MHAHAHARTHTHTHTHARTRTAHTHTHTHTHTRTRARAGKIVLYCLIQTRSHIFYRSDNKIAESLGKNGFIHLMRLAPLLNLHF